MKQKVIKRIFITCLIGVLLVTLGISINAKISEAKKENDIQAFYKNQLTLYTNKELTAHQLPEKRGKVGYYFTSSEGDTFLFSSYFAPFITGYGGPIELIVQLQDEMKIKKIHIHKHNETPAWITRTSNWVSALEGKHLIQEAPLEGIDVVTGATYTCRGILKILQRTGQNFNNILNNTAAVARSNFIIDANFILLFTFLIGALLLRRTPKKWMRIVFMMLIVIVFGFWRNIQFSTYHITRLAQADLFINSLDINFFFFIVLPIVLILTGNLFCGYLCPFGLLQELIHEVFFFVDIKIPKKVDHLARNIKYIFLILIILSISITALQSIAKLDVLLMAFSLTSNTIIGVMIILAISIFFNRFWCRYLCPTGAFLTILHKLSTILYKNFGKKLAFFRKIYKIPRVGKCDLGVKHIYDSNCLCCDRCRYPKKTTDNVTPVKQPGLSLDYGSSDS